MPTEPPTCRDEFSTAEPTPALSTGTPLIAAAALGVIDERHADPADDERRQHFQKLESAPSREKSSELDRPTSIIPAVISQREPSRSDALPRDRARRG